MKQKNLFLTVVSLLSAMLVMPLMAASPMSALRDPFSLPAGSNGAVSGNAGSVLLQQGGSGFLRGTTEVALPPLRFRGYIQGQGSAPSMALLELGQGRVHMVRVGDEINIDPANPRQAIRITRITRLSITVETGTLGQMKVLR